MIFGIDRWPADRPALRSDDGRLLTYGDIRNEMERIGKMLCGRSLIFCLCNNMPEAVVGYLTFMGSGCVSLLLGSHIDPLQLKGLYDIYRPEYFWAEQEKICEDPLAEIITEEAVITYGRYGLYRTGCSSPELNEDLALLLSTSGSTGSPKLIRLSRRNVESNAESIAQYLELTSSELPVTTLPMQYTFGLSVINSHLHVGAQILLTDRSIVQQGFWDLVSEYGATSISGVPYTYELLHRIHFFDRTDTGSITSMIQAGGHLPVELQEMYGRWAAEHGVRFYVMYGQTEATARMSYLPWRECLDRIGSIGIAIPGGRFEIQDEDGQVITETNVPGELVYYGPNVALGYATCAEDLANPDEWHGVLHTRDMASVDKDGYYMIRGRLGRFVKLYGVRVGLDECENILKGLDVDGEFACTGSDERLIIFTDSPRWEEAAQYLSDRLRLNIRAFDAVYMESLPKTESEKKDYTAMKNWYAANITGNKDVQTR